MYKIPDIQPRLKTAKKAILTAGKYLLENFRQTHDFSIKDDNTVLLPKDLESEKILMDTIVKDFPTDSFFTEETNTKISSDYVWVFDPICGSYSYLRGVETWNLSVALLVENSFEIGLVYQPLLNNFFYSTKEKGAFLNDNKIVPSETIDIDQSFISIEHGVFNTDQADLQKLIKNIKRLRVGHGSGGELGYVAAGFLDACIKTDQTIMHFAGGRALIEHAGGVFVDFDGNDAPIYLDKNKSINYVACSNKNLAKKILQNIT